MYQSKNNFKKARVGILRTCYVVFIALVFGATTDFFFMIKLRTSGRLLLVTGGLIHLFPEHLTSIVQIGSGIFTLQRAIGFFSVVTGMILLVRQRGVVR